MKNTSSRTSTGKYIVKGLLVTLAAVALAFPLKAQSTVGFQSSAGAASTSVQSTSRKDAVSKSASATQSTSRKDAVSKSTSAAQSTASLHSSAGTSTASKNTALRTNLLYLAAATANVGVERTLSSDTSIGLDGYLNLVTFSDNMKWKNWMLQPEYRYWFCNTLMGGFIGAHLLGGQYNVGGGGPPFLFPRH